jgi:hypothetical protein
MAHPVQMSGIPKEFCGYWSLKKSYVQWNNFLTMYVTRWNREFDVHGSLLLGNICSIKGPTRCTYYVFFISHYI